MTKKIIHPQDSELFRQAIGEVRPITSDKISQLSYSRPKPYPKPAVQSHEEDRFDRVELAIDPVGYEETLSYAVPGVQQSVLAKLKKGVFGIQAELDLHGYTVAVAKVQLAEFLVLSQARGYRCVHIIHGKGYRSADEQPVLKNQLNHWLRQHRDVLAFCSASPRLGGAGAVLVLLRSAQ